MLEMLVYNEWNEQGTRTLLICRLQVSIARREEDAE